MTYRYFQIYNKRYPQYTLERKRKLKEYYVQYEFRKKYDRKYIKLPII